MALDKADLKISVFENLGAKFDDMQEEADRELYRAQGAAVALKAAAEQIVALTATVKADIDAGNLDLEEAKKVNSYLSRGVQQLHDMMEATRRTSMVHTGRKQGFLEAVQHIRKEHDLEEAKKARKEQEAEEDRAVKEAEGKRLTLREEPPAPKEESATPALAVPKRKRVRSKRTNGANA